MDGLLETSSCLLCCGHYLNKCIHWVQVRGIRTQRRLFIGQLGCSSCFTSLLCPLRTPQVWKSSQRNKMDTAFVGEGKASQSPLPFADVLILLAVFYLYTNNKKKSWWNTQHAVKALRDTEVEGATCRFFTRSSLIKSRKYMGEGGYVCSYLHSREGKGVERRRLGRVCLRVPVIIRVIMKNVFT